MTLLRHHFLLPCSGLLAALVLWHLGVQLAAESRPFMASFAPLQALQSLYLLLQDPRLWEHLLVSLQRVAIGLFYAVLIGVPLGILSGVSRHFSAATGPLFQFLRMVSPLSWMPIAVMLLGVGDAPVYFLLAFAAMWPILLNTAAGVHLMDKNWLLLARSLSATRLELLWHIILPGITAHLLTGIRLAIGIIWIVLVPAEMLGVSAGLGYFILDTRDRLAYDELMAGILLIGLLGFLLDYLARRLHRLWSHQ